MSKASKIVEKMLAGLAEAQGLSSLALIEDDHFKFPRLIPAGDGGTLQITKEVDDLITKLAHELKADRPSLALNAKESEWRHWVRGAVGPLVASTPLSDPVGQAPGLLTKLEDALNAIVANLDAREYAFGTTLFSRGDIARFSFGPVTFEPRQVWLDRKVAEGGVTPVTQRRANRLWTGGRVRPRKSNREKLLEDNIFQAIGPCEYVCSVELSSAFAPEAGLETALTAARLALACSALAFERPSETLRGFNLNYDGPIHSQTSLQFVPGKTILSGSRLNHHPFGPFIKPSDWLEELVRLKEVYVACGEVLDNLVDPSRSTARREILEALLQALIWFEKGCRETGDLMATVGFAASLDALGKGTKAKGILTMLEARLGIKRTDPINVEGPTFQSILDTIYSEGRSRTIHGTNEKIGYDWTNTRVIAEQLARYALIACLDYVAKAPTASKTDDLKK